METIDLSHVFGKLHLHYDAICLFRVSTDSIYQLKFPIVGNENLAASQLLCWSKMLRPVVSSSVCADDHLMVYEFLLPQSLQAVLPTMESSAEIVFRSQNNHWKKLVVHPLSFQAGKVDEILYLLTDQTLEFNRFEQMKTLSERDELTYLFNRTKLNQMLETECCDLVSCGVLFFDVNNLKIVNDTQGHEAGDQLLEMVAESLRSVVNRQINAFRYGGDEFIIIARNCPESYMDTMIRMIETRLRTHSRELGIEASVAVGCAWSDAQHGINVYNLIRIADRDMYRNKCAMKQGTGPV